ncbi:MAG: hypothetical protein IJV90_00540, partial [Candidatus Methanomethylophilaceae archaeon]|nr:hypothetical protein [Candidatus Methanomethylophilaceae archaeon]
EAVWAGIMLTVFHAITKSLMFLCVGTVEHHIGSRDIEDMDGLFTRMPKIALMMLIGIAGMFLAPLGMLISKWAAITSFIDSEYLIAIVCVVFGSAVTSFYWTKWMGKLVAIISNGEGCEDTVHKQEWFVLRTLVMLTVLVCMAFPLLSDVLVIPWLEHAFGPVGDLSVTTLTDENKLILLIMLVALFLVFIPFFGKSKRRVVSNYLAGVGDGNRSYTGSMGTTVEVNLRNWYMKSWFGEDRIGRIGSILASVTLIVVMVGVAGGVFL